MMEKRIRLRALTKSDIQKTLKWHNNEIIKELYAGHPFPVNWELEEKWYEKILTSNFPTTVFGIEIIENSLLIGISVLKNIDLMNGKAEYAIFLGDENVRAKGFAKEATLLTLEFGFGKMRLERIYLFVLEENINAIILYERCGFVKEGLIRKSAFRNFEYKNEMLMAILKDEFKRM
jgi:RimJ/RimL family protein N-acetyltransferase